VPQTSDARFLVAHGLRLKGFAPAPVVAALTGLDEAVVAAYLEEMRAAGHAQLREGRISGWSLTPAGRSGHATACAEEVAACRDAIASGYQRFLVHNQPFLVVCTDWQLRGGPQSLNDHTDAAYDAGVIARLGAIDADLQPVLADLTAAMGRFGGYAERLREALKRVESGEHEWFTGAMIESYHTVWFELHEDLLATLGIERSKEGT
jgi:hypothetical protein